MTYQNNIDPILLRRMFSMITAVDPGTNPQIDFGALIGNTPLQIVVPVNNVRNPLYVYNRGWWGGGTVDAITAQKQTQINITGNPNGNTVGDVLYTVTTGKIFYCTGATLSGADATNKQIGVSANEVLVLLGIVIGAGNSSVTFGGGQGVIFTAPSGTDIEAEGNFGAGNGYFTLWGWEE
jgi:hypothetical protein